MPAQTWYTIKAASGDAVNISIYDEIGFFGIDAANFKATLDGYKSVSVINLSLHSPGGSVFEGLAIYNMLKNHPARVNVFIDGLAASIASVIAMAGDTVTIPENAFLMIHKPWVISNGDAEKLREDADLLDKVETSLLAAYRNKTGLPDDKLSELIAAETWLSGSEAVEMGFADHLAEPIEAAASFQSDLTARFNAMPKSVATPNTNPSRDQVLAQERQRRDEVKAVFAEFDFPELQAACLDDMNCDADNARSLLLAEMGKGREPSRPAASSMYVGNGALQKDSIANAVAARLGREKLEDNRNPYAGMSLSDMSRTFLRQNGAVMDASASAMQAAASAFTHSTGDFGSALADVAHKAVLAGWDNSGETFDSWTRKGSLSDFRTAHRIGLGAFPSLPKVREGAEYTHATIGDRSAPITLAKYGQLFSITREAIINDDLGIFDNIPRAQGVAARRTVGDLVYAILTSNPSFSGTALFDASRNNALTPAALDVASLDAARVAIQTQTDDQGNALNTRPAFVLTPVALEGTARALIAAEYNGDVPEGNVPNPIQGMAKVIADARLDVAGADKFFVVGDPMMHDTIEVAYLDGNDTPYLEEQEGFTVDGVTFKVRIEAGVAPMDWRNMIRSTITP